MADRPLLVTSALPYANGPLHLGHLAGAYLPADLYVRYQRLQGRDVVFVCGSDEHGAAITLRARKEGTTPEAIVDRYHAELDRALAGFGISFDIYGRTSSETHRETSQDMFLAVERAGGFVRKTSTQLYDPEAGLFLADRYVTGTCPVCGYDSAYGDQCENCGSTLSPDDLIEPRSTLTGATPERRETTHWYLPLGDLQPKLEEWIATKTDWKPNVLGQVRSWLQDGLQDRAMTRDLDWGVPVPPEVDGDTRGKVLYVWFDAPIGYVSITREWAERQGDESLWRRYWQVHEDGTEPELVHFIGKDNIVFHCLIFPAILMAQNEAQPQLPQFVLPANVPANEFLNLEGQKLSTSRGWAVWAEEALEAFPLDLLRYGLAVGLPETKDADFSWGEFQARVNGELADVVGNFANRALTFAARFCDGQVPELLNPSEKDRVDARRPASGDREGRRGVREGAAARGRAGGRRAGAAGQPVPAGDRAVEDAQDRRAGHAQHGPRRAPGLRLAVHPPRPRRARGRRAAARDAEPRRRPRLWRSVELGPGFESRHFHASARGLWRQRRAGLGRCRASAPGCGPRHRRARHPVPQDRGRGGGGAAAASGGPRGRSPGGLPRAPEAERAAEPYAPLADEIVFDQFAPLDMRVGKITAAEPHPKADKLLRFDVDMGFETRQILSGVREHLTPEAMLGLSVVVVANLAPRTIRGLESQGMILFAEDRDGRLVPVTTEGEPGAIVR